jgi:rhomboid protease GluP
MTASPGGWIKLTWIICNGLAVVSTLVCLFYLYRACRPARPKWPLLSSVLIGATTVVTIWQFFSPELLAALRRDPDALRAGEWWRLLTALFVQPDGVGQCLANGALMLMFIPAAERLYGGRMLIVYFAAGVAGQLVNFIWSSGSGGSSTAIFGVMGSLLLYVVMNRARLRRPFQFIAHLGLLAAVFMMVLRDGNGVGLIVGAALASLLVTREVVFRSPQEAK